jgi:hypothetical protein
MASKILFATLISMAAAQTTVSIPWIGVDPDIGSMVLDDIQASVVAANPTATTLSLGCAPSQECGLFPAETLIYGPSTYNIYMGDPSPDSDFTGTMDCVIAKIPGSSTTTYEAESVGTFGVLVTAGMDKLNVKAAATAAASVTSEAAATGSGVSGSMATITSAASTKAAAAASGSASVSASASAANISGYVEKVGAAGRNAVGVLGVAAGVLGLLL